MFASFFIDNFFSCSIQLYTKKDYSAVMEIKPLLLLQQMNNFIELKRNVDLKRNLANDNFVRKFL